MKILYLISLFCLLTISSYTQSETKKEYNFGFEKISADAELPDGWYQWGEDYKIKIDKTVRKSGNSSVLIEIGADKTEKSYGIAAYDISEDYIGREIELRGFMKLESVADGYAGLFLRIDGEGRVLQIDNMQSRKIGGTSDWTRYSIKMPLPEDKTKIVFGGLLTGKGKLWIDDFDILIDGQDISKAKIRPPVVYKADSDKEFDKGSKIAAINLTEDTTKNLDILGKVWGFLKYHHPVVAKGEYNWDYELFRILPKILASKNKAERNALLSEWIKGLGTFSAAEPEKLDPLAVKLAPDYSWIDENTLGEKLAKQLNEVKNAKRENKHYYISLKPPGNYISFEHENAYKEMNFQDAGFRLLSLYRYWNIIQYYFPNRHLIGEDWNRVLPEFVPEFVNAKNELEYKLATLKLIGKVNDTHANIRNKHEVLDKFWGINHPPIMITFVENKAVITSFLDETSARKAGLKIGDVIESVNGEKVSEIVGERLELTPASNYPTKLRLLADLILLTNENKLKIKFSRGDKTKETVIETFPKEKFQEAFTNRIKNPKPPFKLIEKDIAYLYPGGLKRGEINEIIPKIVETRGLVIDMRTYPSDFIVFSLGNFLVSEPTDFVKFSGLKEVATPGLFTFREGAKLKNERGKFYKGKVVILVNETTQSSAEYTTTAFRASPNATVIGSTTAGADGNVIWFSLPGGITTMISGIGVYYPDGNETQRIGIVPDILIEPTIEKIRKGKDEVLEKAIEILKTN